MTKKSGPTQKPSKDRKLDIVIRHLEKKVDPRSSSEAMGTCARFYCLP